MTRQWTMIIALGYAASVRWALTEYCSENDAHDTAGAMLRQDRDVERVHILHRAPKSLAPQNWQPVACWVRDRSEPATIERIIV